MSEERSKLVVGTRVVVGSYYRNLPGPRHYMGKKGRITVLCRDQCVVLLDEGYCLNFYWPNLRVLTDLELLAETAPCEQL